MQSPHPPSQDSAIGAPHSQDFEPDWSELNRELKGLGPPPMPPTGTEPTRVVLALSGGADSVHLLHCLSNFIGSSRILAVHVNHQLRGQASDEDEAFCQELCRTWKVPMRAAKVQLDTELGDLERRAREARYTAIGRIALDQGVSLVLTAHHRDDALETLLMRWTRGVNPAGLVGMQANSAYPLPLCTAGPQPESARLRVLRPLLGLSARAIRKRLREREIPWREDLSNASSRFTRNRVRHGLLPLLRATCGPGVLADLSSFQASLAAHEEHLARQAPDLDWEDRPGTRRQSWRLPRAALVQLPGELLRRSLYKSLLALTGQAPRDALLRELQQALESGALRNWNLRGAWGLGLELQFLRLKAPPR